LPIGNYFAAQKPAARRTASAANLQITGLPDQEKRWKIAIEKA
jgi:hypothetical protein